MMNQKVFSGAVIGFVLYGLIEASLELAEEEPWTLGISIFVILFAVFALLYIAYEPNESKEIKSKRNQSEGKIYLKAEKDLHKWINKYGNELFYKMMLKKVIPNIKYLEKSK